MSRHRRSNEAGHLHTQSGGLVFETKLQLDGVNTVVLAMCVLGDQIAVGTLDGRLLLLGIER
jgi:hypothetical protein